MNDHFNAAQSLIRPEVGRLPAYDPGSSPEHVAQQYGLSRIIKMSNNENPYGLSPAAAQAVQECLSSGLGRYPDPQGNALCGVLAERHGIGKDRIILGNGSENLLELLCQAFLNAGDLVVTQAPCFSLYEIFALMMGARVSKVALNADFSCNLPAWCDALAQPVKLILISNPCNPVGSAFSWQTLEAIVRACPTDSLLVIDEAYFEYAIGHPDYPDALQVLAKQRRPWIVLRTFSKAHGLASLRVGYGIASDAHVVDALHRVRTPYNVNLLAQEAAIAALTDTAHLQKSVGLISRERIRLSTALQEMGYRVAPSLTNFLFIDTAQDALQVVERLLSEGIIVKAWREPDYQHFIRASLSLPEDNDAFLRALSRLQKHSPGARPDESPPRPNEAKTANDSGRSSP
ncbi:histidinol-phosphate transaminase [Pseudomonas sp. PA15(2017)]|uniref:histidinol-phosphate transaminase n=1 Tax=Pseudomonas sp. PA15(2017) TaxID=1932111 RepID=UPI00095D7E00|nr:histidinol-phosphate transaminase [Pseudomonas sp. PA15(2017)]OLU23286.1 histidinol-phosphate transaminase [Pseudomonas sp. PA15(2017)]